MKRHKNNRNIDILILNLLLESILDFGKWSNGKYTNTRICVFSVWPLPKVQKWFQKQVWKENVRISILFFFKAFRSIFKKVKKIIFHCIFKKWFDRRRVLFLTNFFSEKAEHPKICLSLGGSIPETQIWKVPNNPRSWLA